MFSEVNFGKYCFIWKFWDRFDYILEKVDFLKNKINKEYFLDEFLFKLFVFLFYLLKNLLEEMIILVMILID